MKNKCKRFLVPLLLLFSHWAVSSQSQELLIIPDHDLLQYNAQTGAFVPYVKERHQPGEPLYLIWDFEKYHLSVLRIAAQGEVSVFINNRMHTKLMPGAVYDLNPDSVFQQSDTLALPLIGMFGEIQSGMPLLLAGKKNTDLSDAPLVVRFADKSRIDRNTIFVFFTLTFILIVFGINPLRLISAVFKPGAEGPDPLKHIYGVFKMILLNGIVFGYFIYRYSWYADEGDMLVDLKDRSESFSYFYSLALVVFFLFLKMIYSKSLEKFFLDKIQLNISVSFMSMLFCAGYLCFMLIFISSFSYYNIPFVSLKSIMFIIFALQVLWLINLSVSSFKWSKSNNLYLFSYLCMAEIMPVALFLKAMKEFVF